MGWLSSDEMDCTMLSLFGMEDEWLIAVAVDFVSVEVEGDVDGVSVLIGVVSLFLGVYNGFGLCMGVLDGGL